MAVVFFPCVRLLPNKVAGSLSLTIQAGPYKSGTYTVQLDSRWSTLGNGSGVGSAMVLTTVKLASGDARLPSRSMIAFVRNARLLSSGVKK